jgi:hypothetical protein
MYFKIIFHVKIQNYYKSFEIEFLTSTFLINISKSKFKL